MTMAIRNTPKRSLKTLYVATNSTFLITTCSVEGPPLLSEAGWLVRRRRINVYYICGCWERGRILMMQRNCSQLPRIQLSSSGHDWHDTWHMTHVLLQAAWRSWSPSSSCWSTSSTPSRQTHPRLKVDKWTGNKTLRRWISDTQLWSCGYVWYDCSGRFLFTSQDWPRWRPGWCPVSSTCSECWPSTPSSSRWSWWVTTRAGNKP